LTSEFVHVVAGATQFCAVHTQSTGPDFLHLLARKTTMSMHDAQIIGCSVTSPTPVPASAGEVTFLNNFDSST
jgi:hypothetical protein